MEISEELKRNLLTDVENICEITLDEEVKESLMRCFEITIGTHEPKFVLSDVIKSVCPTCGSKEIVNEKKWSCLTCMDSG